MNTLTVIRVVISQGLLTHQAETEPMIHIGQQLQEYTTPFHTCTIISKSFILELTILADSYLNYYHRSTNIR